MLEGLILLFAAFVHGLVGFAFALLAVPLLSFLLSLKLVVPLMALFGTTINALLLLSLWRYFELRRIFSLLVGAFPGVVAGAYFLAKAPESWLKGLLGVILISYGLWGLINPRPKIRLGDRWGYLFGFLAGALGAALMTSGPPVVIYVTLKGWEKNEIKSTLQGYFLVLGILVILSHLSRGLLTSMVGFSYFKFLPLVLIGLFLGHRVYQSLSLGWYLRFLYGLLILAGVLALWS